MLAAGSFASSLFSDETFHKFKHNSIKEAWNLLISDEELKKKFEIMFNDCNLNDSTTCTPHTPSNCTIDETDKTYIMDNIIGKELFYIYLMRKMVITSLKTLYVFNFLLHV